jgi:hypothetical protein
MADTTMYQPRVRIRMNHGNTIKEGWALKDTTVEIEFDSPNSGDPEATMRYYAELLHRVGTEEANRRNKEDADG